MKSFCIKNNNNLILNYLLEAFENMGINNVYFTQKQFKNYKNVIIHYKGNDEKNFVLKLSEIITSCIIEFYEKNNIKKIINRDFFYFKNKEKKIILNNCMEIICDVSAIEYYKRIKKIFECVYDYIANNKYFILDGFVNFRLFEYNSILSEIVDTGVNKFVIDKEYKEFVELLREYINTKKCEKDIVHVIYNGNEPILLDSNREVLVYDKELKTKKYLSDINFSSNEYCLNALLDINPKKIIIHLIVDEDDFIETLKLIFQNRLFICKECNICKTFEMLKVVKPI